MGFTVRDLQCLSHDNAMIKSFKLTIPKSEFADLFAGHRQIRVADPTNNLFKLIKSSFYLYFYLSFSMTTLSVCSYNSHGLGTGPLAYIDSLISAYA